jgi:hypothetical protein
MHRLMNAKPVQSRLSVNKHCHARAKRHLTSLAPGTRLEFITEHKTNLSTQGSTYILGLTACCHGYSWLQVCSKKNCEPIVLAGAWAGKGW